MAYEVVRCLLNHHLNNLNWTQKDLADRVGMSKQQINRYVKGYQTMSYEVAYNISMVIGCSMEELYEWTVSKK